MNLMKKADREAQIAEVKSVLYALEVAGPWPRTMGEAIRYAGLKSACPPSVREDPEAYRVYAIRHFRKELAYLQGIPERIEAGELPGWEL